MHIKTIIHLLYKGHSGVLFSVSFLSAALLIEMLAGVDSRAKLLGLLLTCFINRIVTHEINISYTLVGPQALTSNYYHAEPFEMPSFNFTVCLWWKFNSPQMLTTQVNPALISIVSPGTCNNHYFIYYLYFEICIILKQSQINGSYIYCSEQSMFRILGQTLYNKFATSCAGVKFNIGNIILCYHAMF